LAISKRLRYEVLRRDNHTCRYCGAQAPEVKLVVDAVVPEALGGSHKDPANLVTACDPCNNGKSSSSPDAPLVAEVAADALRWAQAMQQAQARMLASLESRQADRQQFAEWWDAWSYEYAGERHTFDRPGGWEQTVDRLTAAGLPLSVLEDCIDLAMARSQVRGDQKFRYMCGIAWSKLTELQEAARVIATDVADDDSGDVADGEWDAWDDGFKVGRRDIAYGMLSTFGQDEMQRYLDAVPDLEPEGERATVAAAQALADTIADKRSLIRAIDRLLEEVSGGRDALNEAHRTLEGDEGTPACPVEVYCLAVRLFASSRLVRAGGII
jgi:hypothetical protein